MSFGIDERLFRYMFYKDFKVTMKKQQFFFLKIQRVQGGIVASLDNRRGVTRGSPNFL